MKISRVFLGVVVFLAVAAIAFGGWYLVDRVWIESHRQTLEAESAQSLDDLGVLVVREPQTKRASTANFCGKPVTETHLKHLKNLHRLGVLLLDHCEVPANLMDTVSQISSINSLSMAELDLTSEQIKQIGRLSNLDSLYLRGVPVADDDRDVIVVLPKLLMLDLSDTRITDAGLKKLNQAKKLDTLLLSGTEITDDGVAALSGMPLKRLALYDTAVTKEGVKTLREHFPKVAIETGARPAETKVKPAEEGTETPAEPKP